MDKVRRQHAVDSSGGQQSIMLESQRRHGLVLSVPLIESRIPR